MGFDGGFRSAHYVAPNSDDSDNEYDLDDSSDQINMSTFANRTARTFTNLPEYPLDGEWPSDGMHFLQFVGMTGQQMRDCLIEMIQLNMDALMESACDDWAREVVRRQSSAHFAWPRERRDWIMQCTFYGIYQNAILMCDRHLDDIFYGEC
jgi:hypothetical protein